jgi:ABC-type iron transport system FetAB permease component
MTVTVCTPSTGPSTEPGMVTGRTVAGIDAAEATPEV